MGRIIVATTAVHQMRDLRAALEYEGHAVTEASSAGEAIEKTLSASHDLLILDSGMAGCDLYDLCGTIRAESDLGIVVLIRDGLEQSRIDALNAGADDYISARFVYAELLARVRAVLRRIKRPGEHADRILLRDRTIDLRSHKIHNSEGQVGSLTPKEYLVLKCLVEHANKPVTNRHLAREVWRRDEDGDFEYVRTVMSQLRRKVEPDFNRPEYIVTERAVGYRFIYATDGLTLPARQHPVRAWQNDNQATVR